MRFAMPIKLYRYFLLLFLAVLAACQSQAVSDVPTNTPIAATIPVVETSTVVPIFTLMPFPTAGPYLTSTPTPTPTSFPISTAAEKFPLDNLRMAYIVEGNLYVQDGS